MYASLLINSLFILKEEYQYTIKSNTILQPPSHCALVVSAKWWDVQRRREKSQESQKGVQLIGVFLQRVPWKVQEASLTYGLPVT